jgi:hypothetical protein
MKITIEPTTDQTNETDAKCMFHKVIIEHPVDTLDALEAAQLVSDALIAWGYHPDNITDIIKLRE